MTASARQRLPRPRRLGLRGASALEFALLMPAVLAVFVLCIELGWQLAVGAALDYGAQRAARLGAVGTMLANGDTAPNQKRKEAIRAVVLNSTGGLLHDARLALSTTSFAGFSADLAAGANGPGTGGQVVRYDLSYVQPFILGALAKMVTDLPSITHTSTVFLTNEPFPDAPK